MCVYSAIADYGRTIPTDQWTPYKFDQFKKVLEEAETFDEVADQPDCESDEKTAWMEAVEERLGLLESNDLDAPLVDDLPDDVAPWAASVEDRLAALEEDSHPQGYLVSQGNAATVLPSRDRKLC